LTKAAYAQHDSTRAVIEAIPVEDLHWSLLAVSMMSPANPNQGPFEPISKIRPNGLLVGSTTPPGWSDHWLGRVPFVGHFLNILRTIIVDYSARYESVADFLAEDLESGGDRWLGQKVALKEDWSKKYV
jgi:hypothetical protein